MNILLLVIYSLIGLISYLSFIKWRKSKGFYIGWDDLLCGLICFGVFWIVVTPWFIFIASGSSNKILDWVNKK